MDALPGLASPSPDPGEEQKQAQTVTETVPQRHPLLSGTVVRSGYAPCVFSKASSRVENVGSGNVRRGTGMG